MAGADEIAQDDGAAAGGGGDGSGNGPGGGPGAQPAAQPDREAMPVGDEQPPRLAFPVVGIGASAGGLEAFIEFLSAMRPDGGMAYVLVQHLPPERESLLAEVLSKKTTMPVLPVEDGLEVRPDHVYVIRPGHVLTLDEGHFRLGPQLGTRAANRPVDDFFRSLAREQRERAVCVVMSGMGSNGTAGAQAVKAVGGVVVAQDPQTAKFPSMPRHLIDQGYADYVLAPADIPAVLLQYAGHPYAKESGGDAAALLGRDGGQLREILAILRTRTRTDFSGYKRPTLLRRVQRRMGLTRTTEMAEYARLLRESPAEVTTLSDDLLIHVTGFFRDAAAWEAMRERVVAPLVARREPGAEVRAWVTACSSGEEAYTLAMLLHEEADRANKPLEIKVFATDMAERPLAHARAGVYPGGIESDLAPERLERFFERQDGVYRVRQFLRECVVFAPQNILSDPPFSRLDVATCRNLLIYLEPDVQQRVLHLLHFGLREGGALFLGASETVAGADDLFEVVDKRARIYRRVGATRHGSVEFPVPHAAAGGAAPAPGAGAEPAEAGGGGAAGAAGAGAGPRRLVGRAALAALTQRTLLANHTPAAVAVDRDNRVLYFHGNTRPFIEQPPGEPTRDLMALLREGVRGAVRIALHRAASARGPVTVADGWHDAGGGRQARVAVTASPVAAEDVGPDYYVVSFELRESAHGAGGGPGGAGEGDGGGGPPPSAGESAAADELRRVREDLQSTIEELQTSNEELKAANEEVTSVNEELQSSNEELETSKEEMQSLNEELTTVNAQLQAKMEEHQSANNDLTALLGSTDIAVLFLDRALRIRRFTPAARELMELITGDVGRPLSDLHRKFDDPDLEADVRSVLERLVPVAREVPAANGRHYARRALPYRTVDNRIDGVVVTFVDVTDRKRAEREAHEARVYAESIVETIHEPLLVLNADLTVRDANGAFYRDFKVKPQQTVGRKVYDLGNGQWDIPSLRQALEDVLPERKAFVDYEVRHDFEGLGHRVMWLNGRQLDHVQLILLGIRDVTADQGGRRDVERAARERGELLRMVVEGARDFAMFMTDAAGKVVTWNVGAERQLGWSEAEAVGRDARMIFTPEDRASGAPEREQETARQLGRAEDERWHVRKDGSRFWGSGVLNVLRDERGGVRGYVKVLRDETLRKRAEEALQASKAAAELANQMKDDFLAMLSHELRTPLSSILIWSKMLRRRPGAPPEYAEALEAITSSAEAQKQLIDDLLDTSRITAGKLRVELRPIELGPLVTGSVETVMPTAEAKGVKLATEVGPDVGVVRADADRLRQVMWNLLTNAVKFTPAGGAVRVAVARQGGEVEIRVSDTGVGISRQFLPHVFEPFRQADPSSTRTYGGLGLGLAICKQLVERHGGSISADSAGANKGATFVVRLPAAAGQVSGGRRAAGADGSDGPATDDGLLRGVRVLLVEDEPATREALAMLLRDAGAMVTVVGTAAAAAEAYGASRPELIVSDVALPDEDGYRLIAKLRSLDGSTKKGKRVPAMALTAFARGEDRDRALAAGFDRHVGKPVDPEQLLAELRSLLAEP